MQEKFLNSYFTVTNKTEYTVLLELREPDGSEVTLETLHAGKTSKHYSGTGAYRVVPLFAPLPEPPLPVKILAEITVTRLLGAPDNTYTTSRSDIGYILVEIHYEGEPEA